MTFDTALQTYTLLTIGDGLVAQIPALIVSVSAGLLVTKSGVHGSAEKAIFQQLSKHPQALFACCGLLLIMSIMPGIPFFPFTIIGLLCATLAYVLNKNKKEAEIAEKKLKEEPEQKELSQEDVIVQLLHIDYIKIELGYDTKFQK